MVELGEGCDTKPYCRAQKDSTSSCDSVGLGSEPPHMGLSRPQESKGDEVDQEGRKKEGTEGGTILEDDVPSIVEIRRVLPPHVFQPSTVTSLLQAARDVGQVVVTFVLAEWLWRSGLLPSWLLLLLLPVYWLLQGTFFTAVFVVGHDAGHDSFSKHPLLNDVVGTIFHTFLLCPFYCWKLSHRHHHKNTGNIDRDEVFYPVRQKKDKEYKSFLLPGFGLGFGWFAYLVTGYGLRPVNHFNPWDPMLQRKACACLISICLVLAWGLVLWQYAEGAGLLKLVVHFVVPDFIFASYTVVITFLHHTEKGVPWYGNGVWGNVRGQLSSIDRHYGWCHSILHSIGTHQIHHLFPKVPSYHLEEATAVFRQRFPHLVRVRSERILPAFFRMFRTYMTQRCITQDVQIHVYT